MNSENYPFPSYPIIPQSAIPSGEPWESLFFQAFKPNDFNFFPPEDQVEGFPQPSVFCPSLPAYFPPQPQPQPAYPSPTNSSSSTATHNNNNNVFNSPSSSTSSTLPTPPIPAAPTSKNKKKRTLHPNPPLAPCSVCDQPLVRLLLRGTKEDFELDWVGRWVCAGCLEKESAGISSEMKEKAGRRKRTKETANGDGPLVCDVCLMFKGQGGIVPKDRTKEVGFSVEYVCVGCENTYQRCTDCGSGGGTRIGWVFSDLDLGLIRLGLPL